MPYDQCCCYYYFSSFLLCFFFIVIDGIVVNTGHKASFCLEDVQCKKNESRKFACKGFGDQGRMDGVVDGWSGG